ADRELDVGLEEGVGAVAVVGDAGVAVLPLDGLVRVRARLGEVPADPDPHLLRRHGHATDSPSSRAARVSLVSVAVFFSAPNNPNIWWSTYRRPRHAEDHYTTVITSLSTLRGPAP